MTENNIDEVTEKDKAEKEKVKEFKSKVAKTVTIAGFLSITKKYEALLDRIAEKVISAVKEGEEDRKLDRQIRQQEIQAIKELAEAIQSLKSQEQKVVLK